VNFSTTDQRTLAARITGSPVG
jgi:hypothetical protein